MIFYLILMLACFSLVYGITSMVIKLYTGLCAAIRGKEVAKQYFIIEIINISVALAYIIEYIKL